MSARRLLDDVSFTVFESESVAIMGASGSGKTTLLNCVLGSIEPHGSIKILGSELVGGSRRQLTRIRSISLGVVFQHGELLEELTPLENVAVAGLAAGIARGPAVERARDLMMRLGIPTVDVATGELSGGERQRTALARALVNSPALILADEPTGSLDMATRDSVCGTLFASAKSEGSALLIVTHDGEVASHADRILDLHDGRLTERGCDENS
ncbi:ATP-binding cassette domain-containing protein [Pseudactinotalea sp. HY160]|nr:ATP-binding cassette domain-containing protein [Pseudactinotalea sp. HY160]